MAYKKYRNIPAYPCQKEGEVIIPRTIKDFRNVIRHIFEEGGLPTRGIRALNLLVESALKYPRLIEENKSRLRELESPIVETKKQLRKLKRR